MNIIPNDNMAIIISFLDGESLFSCSCVNYDFYNLIDNKNYWKNVSCKLYPYLKEKVDLIPYHNNWKNLFKNKNIIGRNRSFVFEWEIHDITLKNERLFSNEFEVGNYKFNLICDPTGNPNVLFMDPSVSLYLKCLPKIYNKNWECCCGFSLICMNKIQSKKNITWYSGMESNKFYKDRESWGVHAMIPLSKLKHYLNEKKALKVKVKLNLLYLKINVFCLQTDYQGFGFITDKNLSYELFECTTIENLKIMIIKDLNLTDINNIRLWIYTHKNETSLSPKIVIHSNANSNTIYEILSPYKNDFNIVKLFVECCTDQTFYETKQNKIPKFIQSNVFSNLPQINYKNDILIFIKYLQNKNMHTTYIIINQFSSLHLLFSLISTITGIKVTNLKAIKEVSPYIYKYKNFKQLLYPNDDKTIESYNIKSGDILTFFSYNDKNKINHFYNLWFDTIKNNLYNLQKTRIIPNFDLQKLMLLCEKIGYYDFWIYNLYKNLNHKSVKDTLSYILSGKHFGCYCNKCNQQNFSGIRYNSLEFDNYDLCESCFRIDQNNHNMIQIKPF